MASPDRRAPSRAGPGSSHPPSRLPTSTWSLAGFPQRPPPSLAAQTPCSDLRCRAHGCPNRRAPRTHRGARQCVPQHPRSRRSDRFAPPRPRTDHAFGHSRGGFDSDRPSGHIGGSVRWANVNATSRSVTHSEGTEAPKRRLPTERVARFWRRAQIPRFWRSVIVATRAGTFGRLVCRARHDLHHHPSGDGSGVSAA